MREDFLSIVTRHFYSVAGERIVEAYKPLIVEVEKIKKQYFKIMAAEGMDQPQRPDFVTENWKPLADAWLKRKKADAGNQRFYYGLGDENGHLIDAIKRLRVNELFGKTEIDSYRDYRVATAKKAEGFMRRGKFIEAVYRRRGGQFGRAREAESRDEIVVSVNPFPNLVGSFSGSFTDEALLDSIQAEGLDDGQLDKLRYNRNTRPLVSAFTRHFYDTRIRGTIKGFRPKL